MDIGFLHGKTIEILIPLKFQDLTMIVANYREEEAMDEEGEEVLTPPTLIAKSWDILLLSLGVKGIKSVDSTMKRTMMHLTMKNNSNTIKMHNCKAKVTNNITQI